MWINGAYMESRRPIYIGLSDFFFNKEAKVIQQAEFSNLLKVTELVSRGAQVHRRADGLLGVPFTLTGHCLTAE